MGRQGRAGEQGWASRRVGQQGGRTVGAGQGGNNERWMTFTEHSEQCRSSGVEAACRTAGTGDGDSALGKIIRAWTSRYKSGGVGLSSAGRSLK